MNLINYLDQRDIQVRLDKFIAQSTELSRALAKLELKRKQITVNGSVERDAGYIVQRNDEVRWQQQLLNWPGPRYLMLHKPKGVECSHNPSAHRSVFDLVDAPRANELQVVGRLDQDTTGLVLLTDDGAWLHALTSPKKVQGKRYLVTCAQPITPEQLAALRAGVVLRDDPKPTLPAEATLLSPNQLQLSIHEGRYHQVKRMLAAVGNVVTDLHRESIAHIQLDADLPEGNWRWLTEAEISLK